jgi:hypothetical protein
MARIAAQVDPSTGPHPPHTNPGVGARTPPRAHHPMSVNEDGYYTSTVPTIPG